MSTVYRPSDSIDLLARSSKNLPCCCRVCVCVCVCLICKDVKLQWFIEAGGTWHTIRDHVQRSYLIVWDTEPDQLCVPAARIFRNNKGPSLEPRTPSFYFFTVATICIFAEHVADNYFDFWDYFAETMSPMYFGYFVRTTSPMYL